jgi:CRP-like cAMP-binding protein
LSLAAPDGNDRVWTPDETLSAARRFACGNTVPMRRKMTGHADIVAAVTRKLSLLTPLDPDDRAAIGHLPFSVESVPQNRYLVREGDEASQCCLLVEGYACRHKTTRRGGRQIVSFHMRGDFLDLQSLLFEVADHNVQTITAATVAWLPAKTLQDLARRRPAIGDALWRDTLIDASIFREWVLNVGRRDARSRVSHMLCEFAARGQAVGLGSPEGFELPMTQEEIADATGLTPVHVNRTLRALREEGVIALDRRHLAVRDWPRLRQIAGFDAAYLHGAAAEAA